MSIVTQEQIDTLAEVIEEFMTTSIEGDDRPWTSSQMANHILHAGYEKKEKAKKGQNCKPDNSRAWHKGKCACVSPDRDECYALRYFPGAMEADGRSYCKCPCHDDYQDEINRRLAEVR